MDNFTTLSQMTGQHGDNGLVQCAKSDRQPQECTLEVYADMVKVRIKQSGSRAKVVGNRAAITKFSRRARKNMLERLAMLRGSQSGYFGTLTYPGKFEHTPEQVQTHLANFRKRFLRRFPDAGIFWRKELQPRKSGASEGQLVPHFHLLIFGVKIHHILLRRWIARNWFEVVGSNDIKHKKAGTQLDKIHNRKHAMRYASKYAAKCEDESLMREISNDTSSQLANWGRRWGTAGNLDFAPVMIITIERGQLKQIKRLVAAWLRSRKSRYAKRFKSSAANMGWAAFGLGDLSSETWADVFDSTIFRMITAL